MNPSRTCSCRKDEMICECISADGALPWHDRQTGACSPIPKLYCNPEMRWSTHSLSGWERSAWCQAETCKGVETGASNTGAGRVLGGGCRASNVCIQQNCLARSGLTEEYEVTG